MDEQSLCPAELVLGYHRRAPALSTTSNGSDQAGTGPFPDEVTLKLAESAEDDDGREAVLQVKTGGTPVDLGSLPDEVGVAFAFQPNGLIRGANSRAEVISRADVLAFARRRPDLLPGTVQAWLGAV
ncbi:hypothetical protein J2847_006773 [Azospirillum agricola]|nr:hypothetical protein [Azospirillum agricola]